MTRLGLRAALSVGSAAALVAAGCTHDPRGRSFTVAGAVTVNGVPLKAGTVTLYPQDATLGADSGRVADGRYEFKASAGRKRVEVKASNEIPPPPPGTADPTYEELAVRQYNGQKEFWVEVGTTGRNTFDVAIDGTFKK